jgi:hypothetical protein
MALPPLRVLHADGSNCFNRVTTIGLTGIVTVDNASLTVTSVDGQGVTFTEKFTNATFTRTCGIKSGCAAGGRGRFTDINIPYIADQLNGTFTGSAQRTFNWQATSRGAQLQH